MTEMNFVPPDCFPMEFPCVRCGMPVHTFSEVDPQSEASVILNRLARITYCTTCAEARQEEQKKERSTSREIEWQQLCPAEFRGTVPHKLPEPSKLDRVRRWHYGTGKGLILMGPTGRGKSRCAWEVCKREFFSGRSVEVIDCTFALEYSRKMSVSPAAALTWLEEKMSASILLMDDALKVRLENSGSETALFAVVNERTQFQRPIILTTQDTGETLKERMSSDRGGAMVRRLQEFCETINFGR